MPPVEARPSAVITERNRPQHETSKHNTTPPPCFFHSKHRFLSPSPQTHLEVVLEVIGPDFLADAVLVRGDGTLEVRRCHKSSPEKTHEAFVGVGPSRWQGWQPLTTLTFMTRKIAGCNPSRVMALAAQERNTPTSMSERGCSVFLAIRVQGQHRRAERNGTNSRLPHPPPVPRPPFPASASSPGCPSCPSLPFPCLAVRSERLLFIGHRGEELEHPFGAAEVAYAIFVGPHHLGPVGGSSSAHELEAAK